MNLHKKIDNTTRPLMIKPWLKDYISSLLGYTDFKWAYVEGNKQTK